jgi:hypothetical protein
VGIAHHLLHLKPYEPWIMNGYLGIYRVGDAHPALFAGKS